MQRKGISQEKSAVITLYDNGEWLTMFENQTMVAAMIDRLTYRSLVLSIIFGRPYRTEFAIQLEIKDVVK